MTNQSKISVISLISYDSYLLPDSIKSYYPYVDEIILGLDKDRISWSNNRFSFDESDLWERLRNIDHQDKITVVEENFHRSSNPIENDTYERNFLKEQCSNNFILSFDADEILINPKEFFLDFLPIINKYKDIELLFTWFMPYKEFDEYTLMIADSNREHLVKSERQGFSAFKNSTFTYCRWTNSNKKILSPLAILHYSFCRSDQNNYTKINNFGHSSTSKNDPFYNTHKQVTLENYTQFTNLKTVLGGPQWPTLKAVRNTQLLEFCKREAELIYEN